MLGAYKEDAESLGIKDLGPNTGATHPFCKYAPFRYGMKPDGTIVEWCTGGCGKIDNSKHVAYCPNCGVRLNYKQDPHFVTTEEKFRIVCPTSAPLGENCMVTVSVEVDGKTESTEISQDLYEILRDGADLRNRPMGLYLYHTVKNMGSLTEDNIRKFLDEHWVI